MDKSNNGPMKSANVVLEVVWYEGTDALQEGEPVCYNTNYGTATDANGNRHNRVERPSSSNNMAFAGVSARNYSAKSTGQMIEIYCPGSRGVKIAIGAATVIDTGFLTFSTGAGRFVKQGFMGRGSAFIRQTVAAPTIEASMVGAWSLSAAGTTLTMASTAGLSVGDTVVILGGANDGTGAVVPGKYKILTVPAGGTTVTIASAVTATAAGALAVTGYAYTGNPTCQADLMDGPESGGVEFISLPNAGGDSQPYMTNGVTFVCGGVTLAADAECELAQGTYPGQRKAFICLGTLTTSDFVVDLATNGVALTRSGEGAIVALAEVNAIDAADDACYLQFNGALWHLMDLAGGATAA